MAQSLHLNYAHVIFSTKGRQPLISGEISNKIYSYLAGIIKNCGGESIAINGMPDHVHLLVRTPKDKTDIQVMKELKGSSSRWINEEQLVTGKFQWQAGYGWFSVGPKDTVKVVNYIRNQAEHHRKVTFQEEYRKFLETYGIEYDERYLWD